MLKPAETAAGVLNTVVGDRGTGRLVVEHPAARPVPLTGSTRAGAQVARSASADLKQPHLELGGNAPALLFDDADQCARVTGLLERLPGLASETPHGEFKHAGYGKDLSAYGLEDYTRVRHMMSALR